MTEQPHAPYLMPGGQHWSHVLKHERDATSAKQKKKSSRAKDDLWVQLQRNKVSAGSEQELQEIRAIEQAGHRRRRRWLNEKVLRDMAGPMSATDMQAQFSPVPFGSYPPPSAFAVAMSAEHQPVWEHFRNIDLDKEAKVLQRWEQHNREQQQQQHRSGLVSSDQLSQQEASASAALNKWRAVSRGARSALKQANVHSVLQLEMQLLQGMEQCGEMLLDLPDGFARLLVHGLAEFHGFTSATRLVNGQKQVLVQRKHIPQQQQPQQQQQQQQQGLRGGQCQIPSSDANNAAAAATDGATAAASNAVISSSAGISSSSGISSAKVEGSVAAKQQEDVGGVEWLLHRDDITCSDVVMALHELGSSFNQHALERYMMTHVHGGSSVDCRSVEDRVADMQC